MRMVFVDTLYWIAQTSTRDPWHGPATAARARLAEVHLVTTDEVLVEFLTAFATHGAMFRRSAALAARSLIANASMTVVDQSWESLLKGIDLYERRLDKGYSLTDCISMNAMRERGITDVLTNDHHFEQEGFNVLIRR